MRRRKKLPRMRTPSSDLIEEYWSKYRADPKYSPDDSAVQLAFKTFPDNLSLAQVRLKVSILNDVYSTGIYGTLAVARHICDMRIDRRLRQHDPKLVNDIANVPVNGKTRRCYSFASKYCSIHQPDGYAIFDSFVEQILLAYKQRDGFLEFNRKDLRQYPTFMAIIDDFRSAYEIESVSLRKLDKFLWLYGKKCFGKPSKKAGRAARSAT